MSQLSKETWEARRKQVDAERLISSGAGWNSPEELDQMIKIVKERFGK